MKQILALIFLALISISSTTTKQIVQKPTIAFSFDDGNPEDILNYKGAEWNAMILNQLEKHNIQSVWFVCAKGVYNEEGKLLLLKWDQAGNFIANHTYNHPNYNTDLIEKFKKEGWDIANYSDAIKDPIYNELPTSMPAEQSLIWAMAKQSGMFEKQLRYPGEDGEYEKDKMDKLGL